MGASRLDSFSVAPPPRDGVAVRVTAPHAGSAARPSHLFVRAVAAGEGVAWELHGSRGAAELRETGELPDGFTLGDGETLELELGVIDELWAVIDPDALGAELRVLQTQVVGEPARVTVGGPVTVAAISDTAALSGTVVIDVFAEVEGGTDPLEVSFTQPEYGSVAAGATAGTVEYTADDAYTGDDTFEVTVTDAEGREDTAVVTITITGA